MYLSKSFKFALKHTNFWFPFCLFLQTGLLRVAAAAAARTLYSQGQFFRNVKQGFSTRERGKEKAKQEHTY